MSALDKLALAEMQEAEEAREGFRVTDKGSADWCLRKIAAYRAEMAENQELVQAEIERLQQWLKAENEKAEQSIAYFSGCWRSGLEPSTSATSANVASACAWRIRLKKQQQICCSGTKKCWYRMKKFSDLIQTVETYNKSNIKAFIKKHCEITPDGVPVMATTGEIMSGVKVTERGLRFEFQTEGK